MRGANSHEHGLMDAMTLTLRIRRLVLVLLPVLVVLALLADAARAGSYIVDGCADPAGVATWGHIVRPTDGWFLAQGVYPSGNECAEGLRGRGLYASTGGIFRFDAPEGTKIDRLDLWYRAHLSAASAWAVPTFAVEAEHGTRWEYIPPAYGHIGGAPVDLGGGWGGGDAHGADAVEIGVRCELQGPCVQGGAPEASFRALAVRLSDSHPPALSLRAPGGHLQGVVPLEISAADGGGGLFRVSVAGALEETLCDVLGGGAGNRHVLRRVPCPRDVSRTISLDTRSLPDGERRVVARAEDVGGEQREAAETILVDNLPPAAGTVAITGEPRVGEALTAEVAGFSGQDVAYEYRWQRCDADSAGCADVGGAVERTYAPRTGDAGHRLRARVTASDRGGSTTVMSAPTALVGGGETPAPVIPAPEPAAAGTLGAAPAGSERVKLSAWLERGHRRLTRVTTAYGVRVRIRGRLTDPSGRPLGRTPVAMQERPDGARWRPITGVRTRSDGRFTTFTKVGPSRRFRLEHDGVAVQLRQLVRAPVTVHARGHGGLAGRVGGGWVPPGGVLVAIQLRRAGHWVTWSMLRSDRAGRFGTSRRVPAGRLRAEVPRQPGFPFLRGVSR